jgi:hypothetical protein
MTKKLFILASIVLLGSASFATAAERTRYVTRTVPQGGRFATILVPADDNQSGRTPYALTGRSETQRPHRAPTIPSHPRGTHSW